MKQNKSDEVWKNTNQIFSLCFCCSYCGCCLSSPLSGRTKPLKKGRFMAMVYMQELCFWRVYVSCPLAWIYLLVFSALDSSHILFYRQLNSLAGDKMKIRPKRHHKTATNPIKNLQQRTDVRTDTEVHFAVLFILKLCLGISVH